MHTSRENTFYREYCPIKNKQGSHRTSPGTSQDSGEPSSVGLYAYSNDNGSSYRTTPEHSQEPEYTATPYYSADDTPDDSMYSSSHASPYPAAPFSLAAALDIDASTGQSSAAVLPQLSPGAFLGPYPTLLPGSFPAILCILLFLTGLCTPL